VESNSAEMGLILDVDAGVDDAFAIMLALWYCGRGKAELHGITTVSGNVHVDQVTANVRILLDFFGALDVEVYKGAAEPVSVPYHGRPSVHGRDGFGGLGLESDSEKEGRGAVEFLIDTVQAHSDELTVVALGPLTNIAVVMDKHPDLVHCLSQLVVMGGSSGQSGNVTPCAEFNFWTDPHAARRVLQAGLPITVVPLDVTKRIRLERETLEKKAEQWSKSFAEFILGLTSEYMNFYRQKEGFYGCYLHDPLAVFVALESDCVSTEALYVDIETNEGIARGQVIVDRRPIQEDELQGFRTTFCIGVNEKRFWDAFFGALDHFGTTRANGE